MTRPDQLQLPPPNNEEEFEKLCLDLWGLRYQDSGARRVGRSGQGQNGVDIYLPEESIGVQCKKKESHLPLREKRDVFDEIDKALKFPNTLKEYVIATTAKRDAKLQKRVWERSEDHAIKGLFRINLAFWDDILEWLSEPKAREILGKYYPDTFRNSSPEISAMADRLEKGQSKILAEVNQVKAQLDAEVDISNHQSEFNGDLETAKNLLKARQPRTALALLERIEENVRARGNDADRYLLLARLGAAHWDLDHDAKAARFFMEALRYRPNDEKALLNAARACLTSGQNEEARRHVDQVLQKNPLNESAQAVRVNLAPLEIPLENIIEAIPASCRASVEVAFAVAIMARKQGRLRDAKQWLEAAQKNNDKGIPEIPAYLGMTILELLLEDRPMALANQVYPDSVCLVAEAHGYLKTAWDIVKDTELKILKVDWLDSIALTKILQGNLREAEADISYGLKISPSNKALLFRKAQLAFRQERPLEAADALADPVFQKMEGDIDQRAVLLRSAALKEARRYNEARELVVHFLKDRRVDDIWEDAAALLIEIDEDSDGPEASLKRAEELLTVRPDSAFLLGFKAVLLGKMEKKEEALQTLAKAKSHLLKEKGSKWGVPSLAEACFKLEQFAEAADFYEKFIPPDHPSPQLKRLVYSYLKGSNPDKALTICQDLRNKYGPLPFYTEEEIHLLDQVNDRPKAAEVCDAYLEKFPSESRSTSLRIFRCRLGLDLGQTDKVDQFLNSIHDLSAWDFDDQTNTARLFALRGRIPEALDHFYEIRRRFHQKSEAHLAYVSVMFAFEKETSYLSDIQEAGKDTAVHLIDENGNKTVYVIEERHDPDPREKELSSNHPLAQALSHKKRGERITWEPSEFSKETFTVEKVESKYIYRFNESTENFEKNFPNERGHGLTKIKIQQFKDYSYAEAKNAAEPKKEDAGNQKMGLDPKQFLETLAKARSEWAERVAQIYRSGAPLCAAARASGQSVLDIWSGLSQDPNTGIRCAIGMKEESAQAILALEKKPRLVVDVITLRSILNLDLADSVTKQFGQLLVAQSTIDLLRETILERKPMRTKGFLSVGWKDGRLSGVRVSPEDVENAINVYERDLSWIEKNAEVPPAYSRLQFPAERIKRVEDLLGGPFLDTILLCLEKGRIMLSDDMAFRAFARNEFKVDGVWTQPLLLTLLAAGTITKEIYNRAIILLAEGNYRYLSVDDSMLLQSAEESKWQPSHRFHQIAAFLGGALTSDENSAVSVAGNFLYSLWARPETIFQRNFLAQAALKHLVEKRSIRQVLEKLSKVIRLKCRLIPFTEREILGIIRSFLKTMP